MTVVVIDEERDQFMQICEKIEQETGTGRTKWRKTAYKRRVAYMQKIVAQSIFQGSLNFVVHHNTRDYAMATVETIALALKSTGEVDYKATIVIDGLSRTQQRRVGRQLRRLGVRTKKIRGVKKDENNALIRLADAVCGFVRAALEGQSAMQAIFEKGRQKGTFKNLSEARKNPRG